MRVPYVEGVAIHIGPEPCADACKGAGEASPGECMRTDPARTAAFARHATELSENTPLSMMVPWLMFER